MRLIFRSLYIAIIEQSKSGNNVFARLIFAKNTAITPNKKEPTNKIIGS